ncbi:hypothetical protein ALC60_00128 [Trachymyrmex zeteki]|uniref:Uncharacterized protein n=1 Tax=Mycetomoellerius zeteki TaxID=64791 RepID=A0A151XKE2_9HYME|nr:hypothetical protein ALC60_00128 [Trachymyrmex zeteki]
MVFYYIYLFPISSSTERESLLLRLAKEGRKILGSWLVCELTFFMDTDSTGTPETAVYPRYAAYIVLSSRGVRTGSGEGRGFEGEG